MTITIETIADAISYTWGTKDFARCSSLLQGMWLLTIETDNYTIVEEIQFLQDIARILNK